MNARLHVPLLLAAWIAGWLIFVTQWSRPTSPAGLLIGGAFALLSLVTFWLACRWAVHGRIVAAYLLALAPGMIVAAALRLVG